MREPIQTGLRVSAVFFLLWALGMAGDPLAVHKLFSVGPYDPVTHALLGGAFLGFAIMLLIGSSEPRDDITGGMAVMMITFGVVGSFNMAANAMASNVVTVLSLIFVLGMGIYLIGGQLQTAFSGITGGGRAKARPKAKKKPAKKAKKKVAKKKAKKKATKKRRR